MKILLIEDDAKTAQAIRSGFRTEGWTAVAARSGNDGLAALDQEQYDVVVLDWMLPDRDGIDVLKWLRKQGRKTPVLLLTARDAVEDRVAGLDSGADDYLVKPFAFAELLARVRALARRSSDQSVLITTVGPIRVDLQARRAWREEDELVLTPREFELLTFLMRHHGQIVTRQMLAQHVWRETNRATPLDNVIDVHIAHVRRKIDDGRQPKLIHTVRGVGFMLREDENQ